jgi:alkaline phosphatase
MGSTSSGSPFRDSRLLRIIRMDITDPLDLQVTGQFVVLMSSVEDYPAGNFPRDLKVSAVCWVSEGKLLFLERTDKPGSGGAKLILVDVSCATNVQGWPEAEAEPLVFEHVSADLVGMGITPAATKVILDVNVELPSIIDYKLEGLAILNDNTVAMSNDNDFGMLDPNAVTKLYQIKLNQPLR